MKDFKQNLKLYIWFSVFYETACSLYIPFMAKLLDRFGGSDFDITLLNVIKGLVMVVSTLPIVYYINKKGNIKKSVKLLLYCRAFSVFLVALFISFKFSNSSKIFLILVALISFTVSAFDSIFQTFTADVFPLRRASVISKKSMFTIVSMSIFTLLVGLIFKFYSNVFDELTIYQACYVVAFIFILISIYIFSKFDYNKIHKVTSVSIKNSFKHVLKNKPYRKFIVSSTIFYFGWTMGWPLFSIYTIKNLGADEMWISVISVISTVSMFFSLIVWPKIIDKIGEGRVAFIATLGMSLTPILYAISSNLYILAVVSFVTGIFTSATTTVLIADLLRVSPEEDRFLYTAYYNISLNLMLAISPFIGQYISDCYGIIVALYVTAIFRLIGSISFFLRRKV